MDRTEMTKKFFMQAQRMTIGMAASVLAYGAIGYYLIHMGKAGPAIMNDQTYSLVKYGALIMAVMGIFGMRQVSARMSADSQAGRPATQASLAGSQAGATDAERHPRKLFVRTILMSAGAELPVLLGMIMVFLGHQPYDYIPFAIVSLAGFAFAYPKKQQWTTWLGADF